MDSAHQGGHDGYYQLSELIADSCSFILIQIFHDF